MAEYIERNDVYELFPNSGFARLHVADIDKIPSADVEPVKHGRWNRPYISWIFPLKIKNPYCFCTNCVYPVKPKRKTRYCPNCGAKMDLEATDET